MKTRLWSATFAALAVGAVVTVLAQDPQTGQPPQASQSASEKTITVTGCVQRTSENPVGTGGTTGSSTSSSFQAKFILSDAAIDTTGAAGTAGTTNPPSTAVASEYRLDAAETKLTPHIGHKVQITGTVAETPATREQQPVASAANAPILKVDKVKMLASTCR